jgi:predicted Zn-ribbon and HTH transcriptional regulator
MRGGFMCPLCIRQGNDEIISPNECKSCGYVVCSEYLRQIGNKYPQERKNTEWNAIDRLHPQYN